MAGEALYYGTGRRKNAVARVRLVPGTGKVTINGRALERRQVIQKKWKYSHFIRNNRVSAALL